MKKLADRLDRLQISPTLAMANKAIELKAQGKQVVDFSVGEPDFDTPANIKTAGIQAIRNGKTKYTAVAGTNALKDAVITKLKRDNGLDYTREEITTANGGKHVLFNLALALFDEGDEVIVPAPYWVSYPDQIKLCGAVPVIISTDDSTQFKITPTQLKQAITKKTKALILNSPSNPTGAGYQKNDLEEIAKICVDNELYIISDEIYEHIVYDGFKHVSIASLSPQTKALTIIVNGASKGYAMTGWRMGFAAGPINIIKAMNKLQGQSTSNVCSITQEACVEAFAGSQEAIQKMVTAFKERRDYIVKATNTIPNMTTQNPIGAFYVFPNISKYFGKKTNTGRVINSSTDFCLYLLEEHLVATVPGSAFGADHYFRISYATDMNTIKEGVSRIKKAVETLR